MRSSHQQHAWAEAQTAPAVVQDTERSPKAAPWGADGGWQAVTAALQQLPAPVAGKCWHPTPACSCLSQLIAEGGGQDLPGPAQLLLKH